MSSSSDKLFKKFKDAVMVAENVIEDPAITDLIRAFAAMEITYIEVIASLPRKRSRSSVAKTPTGPEECDYRPTTTAKRQKTMPSPTSGCSPHRERVISKLKKFKSELDEVIIQLENDPEISVKNALQGMLSLSRAKPLDVLAPLIEPLLAEKQPLALVVEPRPAEDQPLALTVERQLVEGQPLALTVESQSSVVEKPSELIAEVSSTTETVPDYNANLSRKRNSSEFDAPSGTDELDDEFGGFKKRRVMSKGEIVSSTVTDADTPIDLSTKRRPIRSTKRLRNRHGIFQPWLQTE